MPEVSVEIEVYCGCCGAGLCNQTESTLTRQRKTPCFRVEPCEKCLDAARDKGYDNGYADGEAEGED